DPSAGWLVEALFEMQVRHVVDRDRNILDRIEKIGAALDVVATDVEPRVPAHGARAVDRAADLIACINLLVAAADVEAARTYAECVEPLQLFIRDAVFDDAGGAEILAAVFAEPFEGVDQQLVIAAVGHRMHDDAPFEAERFEYALH